MNSKFLVMFGLLCLTGLMAMQFVASADFDQPISDEDKATFDEILEPIMKIYNLVKYSATVWQCVPA